MINTGALNVTLGGGILGWGLISAVITIACGVGMLKGENWGRLGYIFLQPLLGLVTGMVTGFVVADSARLLLFGVVVYLLTREAPSKFFGGPLLRGTKQALAGAISLVTVVALIGTALGSGRSEPSDDRAEEEFRLGMEFFQTDDAKAARWLRRAADHGHEWAQIQLGVMYQEGLGVEQDEVEAVRLYRRAADQGNIIAQTNLAAMYMDGRGVAEDDVRAARLYHSAADQGNAFAQFQLGTMYMEGEGVPQDDVEAHMWLTLSISRVSTEDRRTSTRLRNSVAARMTPEQVASAESQAREWTPTTR